MRTPVLVGAWALAAVCVLFGSVAARADVTCGAGGTCTQTIHLSPGWNAVYVKVAPADPDVEAVLADLVDGAGPQLASVWTWLAHRARIDFVQDPDTETLLSEPGWLRFFPASSGRGFLTNLHRISANRAYLIRLEGDTPTDLVVTGEPVLPHVEWVPDALNLVGFYVDGASPPTFADFLAASPAHAESAIYRLDSATGQWQAVDPMTAVVQPDAAYWVYCRGGSDYTGPVELEDGAPLSYGPRLQSLAVKLHNVSPGSQAVSVRVLANGTPILRRDPDPASDTPWLPFPADVPLAPGETRALPVGVRRAAFAPGDYAETMELAVPGLSRWWLPITASAPSLKGLWVGVVTIEQVSQANNYAHDCDAAGTSPGAGVMLCTDADGFPVAEDPSELTAVASPFQFRILLHEDVAGQVRLLKDVVQMWQDGSNGEPGHYVLLTDDTLIPSYQGVRLRDGVPVGVRISTVAYDFEGETLDMTGSFGDLLRANLVLASGAPTNPFLHRYHPDHDNLGPDFKTPKEEAYAITRRMQLTFEPGAGGGLGAGYGEREGTYREVVYGLHKNPIMGAGRFVLRHLASTPELNQ